MPNGIEPDPAVLTQLLRRWSPSRAPSLAPGSQQNSIQVGNNYVGVQVTHSLLASGSGSHVATFIAACVYTSLS